MRWLVMYMLRAVKDRYYVTEIDSESEARTFFIAVAPICEYRQLWRLDGEYWKLQETRRTTSV